MTRWEKPVIALGPKALTNWTQLRAKGTRQFPTIHRATTERKDIVDGKSNAADLSDLQNL